MAKTHDFLQVYNNIASIKTSANFYMDSSKVGPITFDTGSFPTISEPAAPKYWPVHLVFSGGEWKLYAEIQSGPPAGSITLITDCFSQVIPLCIYPTHVDGEENFIHTQPGHDGGHWWNWIDWTTWTNDHMLIFPTSATAQKPLIAQSVSVNKQNCYCALGGGVFHIHFVAELAFTFWTQNSIYMKMAGWRVNYNMYDDTYWYGCRSYISLMKTSTALDDVEGEYEYADIGTMAGYARRDANTIYTDLINEANIESHSPPYLDELMAVQMQAYPSYKITIVKN